MSRSLQTRPVLSKHAAVATWVTTQVKIIHATGLHARPSVLFTKLAKSYSAAIDVADNAVGPWLDAKSIVKVMGLKAPFGTQLYIRAKGRDAEIAVVALRCLVENDFEEFDPQRLIQNVQQP